MVHAVEMYVAIGVLVFLVYLFARESFSEYQDHLARQNNGDELGKRPGLGNDRPGSPQPSPKKGDNLAFRKSA